MLDLLLLPPPLSFSFFSALFDSEAFEAVDASFPSFEVDDVESLRSFDDEDVSERDRFFADEEESFPLFSSVFEEEVEDE